MGVPKVTKSYVINKFPKCFSELRDNRQHNGVVIIDFNFTIKYLLRSFDDGQTYIKEHFLNPINKYLENGAKILHLILDTKSPPNKYEEQKKRLVGVEAINTPKTFEDLEKILTPQSIFNLEKDAFEMFINTLKIDKNLSKEIDEEVREYNKRNIIECKNMDDLLKTMSIVEYRNTLTHGFVMKWYISKKTSSLLVLSDLVCPKQDLWKNVTANYFLKLQIMSYISMKLIRSTFDYNVLSDYGIYEKYDKLPKGLYINEKYRHLYFYGFDCSIIRKETLLKGYTRFTKTWWIRLDENSQRRCEVVDFIISEQETKKLQEGEIMCVHVAEKYLFDDNFNDDITIVSVDFDVILISLIRMIIWPSNKNLFIILRSPSNNTKSKLSTKNDLSIGKHLLVDMQKLYESIITSSEFGKFTSPIIYFSTLLIMIGTDYVKNVIPYLSKGANKEKTPWLLLPLIEDPERYSKLIDGPKLNVKMPGLCNPDKETQIVINVTKKTKDKSMEVLRNINKLLKENMNVFQIYLNEELFMRYFQHCYIIKTRDVKTIQKKINSEIKKKYPGEPLEYLNGDDKKRLEIEIFNTKSNVIYEHYNKGKFKVPSKNQFLVSLRKTRFNLEYWFNAPSITLTYPNPCLTHNGLSYYGWVKSPEDPNKCITAGEVCLIPDFMLNDDVTYNLNPEMSVEKILNTTQTDILDLLFDDKNDNFNIIDDVSKETEEQLKKNKDFIKKTKTLIENVDQNIVKKTSNPKQKRNPPSKRKTSNVEVNKKNKKRKTNSLMDQSNVGVVLNNF